MTPFENITICAPATIPGTGAIAIIRVSGPNALSIGDKIIRLNKGTISESKGYSIRYGVISKNSNNGIKSNNDEVLDEVLVSIFRNPHSYTGEDSLEISCHSSKYIVSEILRKLIQAGCQMAKPGEFTQRAFLNGKMDLAQAEAVADVISCTSEAAHRMAFKQLKGGFSEELAKMRAELLELVSLMELELDFSEEEVEFADRTRLNNLLIKIIEHISRLMESFKLGNAIKNGVPVAIVGSTNTGKSTLLNALLGEERAIVSDIHGTTRDTIEESINLDGILFRFIDTAGLRESSDYVEKIGIERSYQKISQASVILALLDVSREESEIQEQMETIFSDIVKKIDAQSQKLFVLLNKIDKLNKVDEPEASESESIIATYSKSISNLINSPVIIPLSAREGTGIEELKNALADSQKGLIESNDETLISNMRHYEALSNAKIALERVLCGNAPTDLLAQDLREALYHLGSIVGEISTDEVLGNIFKNFCIGK